MSPIFLKISDSRNDLAVSYKLTVYNSELRKTESKKNNLFKKK